MRVPEPLRCLLAVLLLCTALPAGAHSRSVSYSSWQIDVQGAEVQLRLPLVALNPLGLDPRDPKTPAEIASRVSAGFVLSAGDAACIADGAAARRGEAEILVQARWRCPRKPEFLQSSFLLDRIPSHLHLLQLHDGERRSGPWALGSERQRIDLRPLPAGEAPRFGRYLALGVEHILSG
ncbi:MAG TPA: hypothetical protein VLI06_04340, partial [Solimonas sp.]|nr:hypothetical protein [Solimonas sp.]